MTRYFRISYLYLKELILVSILFTAFYNPIYCQNTDSLLFIKTSSDTVLVFTNNEYLPAIVLVEKGNKIQVQTLSDKNTMTVKNKRVFKPVNCNNSYYNKIVRFRYRDPILADDIIVKGVVLGTNNSMFLLEFEYNYKTITVVKHKSEIIQKDLNQETNK